MKHLVCQFIETTIRHKHLSTIACRKSKKIAILFIR